MNTVYNITDLILKSSLYECLEITDSNFESIYKYLTETHESQFDCYCIECSKDTTFKLTESDYRNHVMMLYSNKTLKDKLSIITSSSIPQSLHFACQRDSSHKFTVILKCADTNITKIGQHPSMADIEIPGIQKYEKLLKKDYKDFSKALGLHSHGVGAGSFVYLRRIFENLIEDMRQEVIQNGHWDDDLYQRSRMDEKIKLLQDKLPDVLVENRSIYGIMSKGIHELTESECLALFPDVKLGIELILDEKLYQLEKQSKLKSFSNFVSAATADLKS